MSIRMKVTVYNWILTLLLIIPFLVTWVIGVIWSVLDYYWIIFNHRVVNITTYSRHAEMQRLLDTSRYYKIPVALTDWRLKKTKQYKAKLERNVI
jgi:hypothetical protein